MKIYEFSQPLYPFRFMACVGEEAITDFFEEDCDEISDDVAITYCRYTKSERARVVLIRYRSLDDMNANNITHECGHLGFDVFEVIGMDANTETAEAFCYLTGWTAGCCEWLKDHLTGAKTDDRFAGVEVFDTDR